MTGNVERITYKVFKDPENQSTIESVYVERLDMESGRYKVNKKSREYGVGEMDLSVLD
jgi:hypothetical protein